MNIQQAEADQVLLFRSSRLAHCGARLASVSRNSFSSRNTSQQELSNGATQPRQHQHELEYLETQTLLFWTAD
eukprot:15459065-Alexandrium_andersonii.AAC.1